MTEKADKQRSVQPHGDAAMGVPAEATTVPQAPQSSPGDTNTPTPPRRLLRAHSARNRICLQVR